MPESDAAQNSLGRSAMVITVLGMASRVTGFVRVVVLAYALGTTFLANTYQTANTAPNLVFDLVASGVLTSIFVPTFVEYLARGDRERGWHAANALTTFALAALILISLMVAFAAPVIMRLFTIGVDDSAVRTGEIALGSRFLRLFSPQIALYGAGMIMTSALHANRRFVMPAIAPIFNNVVVIGVYVVYAVMQGGKSPSVMEVTSAETFVLGAGTTLGVAAMTLCMAPQLRRLGWRFRLIWEPGHPAVRKGVRIGGWALGYAGGYQFGLIVVLIFANRIEGGVAAYQWAYTFFYLPHALFAVPIFHVLFTAMSEHVVRGEESALLERLGDGLRMLAFVLLPISGLMLVASEAISQVSLQYGNMTPSGATLVARVLALLALGLPTYSTFLVVTRAYYAYGDTRTPALINFGTVSFASALGVLLFWTLPGDWEVPGLALGHSVGFAVGAVWLIRDFSRRVGSVASRAFAGSLRRTCLVFAAALVAMLVVQVFFAESSRAGYLFALVLISMAGGAVYLGGMYLLRAPELQRLAGLLPFGWGPRGWRR